MPTRALGGPLAWWLAAALGVAVLPWHMQQDGVTLAGLWAMPAEDADAAAALTQALRFGRGWFWPVVAALLVALPGHHRAPARLAARRRAVRPAGDCRPGPRGRRAGLDHALAGRAVRPDGGPAVRPRRRRRGRAARLAVPADRRAGRPGAFRGDRFVAGAVGLLGLAILLFAAWPVATMLAQLLTPRDGLHAWSAFGLRIADRRIWGLGCLAGGGAAAWPGTPWRSARHRRHATVLGLAFALIVTRTGLPAQRALRLLTVLPIITPPFVIGLGADPAVRPRRPGQPVARRAVRHRSRRAGSTACPACWLAQLFAFTPIAFLVLLGVVEGVSPTLEEAAQTLRADRWRTFCTVTLPLMRPGLANAFLVGFIESIADFGNPIVLGGKFGVLSTEIFFAVVGAQHDQGRAGALGHRAAGVRAGRVLAAARVARASAATSPITGKGDAGLPTPLPAARASLSLRDRRCRGRLSRSSSTHVARRRLRRRSGAATTRRRSRTSCTAFAHRADGDGGWSVGRRRVELALHDGRAVARSPRR